MYPRTLIHFREVSVRILVGTKTSIRFNTKVNAKISAKIAASTIGVVATIAYLLKLSTEVGFLTVFLWYTLPYMWCNFWLVTYTWLQHCDPSVPQYGPEEWTWVRGALSTIDRPYGITSFSTPVIPPIIAIFPILVNC